jgi:hypothetical protein
MTYILNSILGYTKYCKPGENHERKYHDGIRVCNLPHARQGRSKTQIADRQVLAVAHDLVPRLESLSGAPGHAAKIGRTAPVTAPGGKLPGFLENTA